MAKVVALMGVPAWRDLAEGRKGWYWFNPPPADTSSQVPDRQQHNNKFEANGENIAP